MDQVAGLGVSCFLKSWVRRVNGVYIYISKVFFWM
jgi:hypothetical protein